MLKVKTEKLGSLSCPLPSCCSDEYPVKHARKHEGIFLTFEACHNIKLAMVFKYNIYYLANIVHEIHLNYYLYVF